MRVFKLSMTALVLLTLVSACSTAGQSVSRACVGALRLSPTQIETLTGEQARRLLDLNEDQARHGCAVPNR
jgi:outer membrane protein assembly factor BamE (lipoprotein component of BamABCDE complex)